MVIASRRTIVSEKAHRVSDSQLTCLVQLPSRHVCGDISILARQMPACGTFLFLLPPSFKDPTVAT